MAMISMTGCLLSGSCRVTTVRLDTGDHEIVTATKDQWSFAPSQVRASFGHTGCTLGDTKSNHHERVSTMRLVIIGGTGLIGSKLVTKLREHGHEAVPASPDTGVNTLTGEGLAEALRGAVGRR